MDHGSQLSSLTPLGTYDVFQTVHVNRQLRDSGVVNATQRL